MGPLISQHMLPQKHRGHDLLLYMDVTSDAIRTVALCHCCGDSAETRALISHFDAKVTRLEDKWGSRSRGRLKIHVVLLVWTYAAKSMYSESMFALRTPDSAQIITASGPK